MNDDDAPVLPKANMNCVPAARPVTGRVVSNDSCMSGKSASFVRHTVIDVGGTALEGALLAGQAFGVIPPGRDDRGRPHKVRLYSLACPSYGEDGAGRMISTTPKRLIDELRAPQTGDHAELHRLFLGVCSNHLCALQPGDEVKLSGPNGKRFLLPVDRDAHDYLFIATGTGIAPFRGMVLELLRNPERASSSRIHLIAGSPYSTDLLYHDLFSELAARHSNFHYHTAISREPLPDGRPGRYVHDLLDEHMETFAPLLADRRTLLYVCGVAGMQAGIFSALTRHGLDRPYFAVKGSAARGADPSSNAAPLSRATRATARCMLEVY